MPLARLPLPSAWLIPTLTALGALLPLTSCAHFPENRPLERYDPARPGYRFENLACGVANTDSMLVCLSFSGGGTRAGALAYGVVRRLYQTRLPDRRRLLDEVDVISASSGGAFPAAYLGLYGAEEFLARFRERVLLRDLGMEIFWRGTLCPYNLVRLCSPWWNRSELASELYEATIFGTDTFTHLQRRGRPFVVLNATDISLGERFEFTQDQFDLLGSSLTPVPIARAVAASSAFPFLLTPVAFANYPQPAGYCLPPRLEALLCPPAASERADEGEGEGERGLELEDSLLTRSDRLRARDRTRLLREKERHPWIHVADAGVVDNLGLGYVSESYRQGAIRDLLDSGRVKDFVLVVVNARSRPPDETSASPQAPGFVDVLSASLSAAIDQQASQVLRDLRERQVRDARAGRPRYNLHLIEVDLDDLPDEEQRERLLQVETTFALEPEVIDELIEAGDQLLSRSPAFQRLLEGDRVTMKPSK